jgi:hypothetical protein
VVLDEVVEAHSAGKVVGEVDRVERWCHLVRELGWVVEGGQRPVELLGVVVAVEVRHAELKGD